MHPQAYGDHHPSAMAGSGAALASAVARAAVEAEFAAASPADSQSARHILQVVIDNIPQRVFWKDLHCNYLGCNLAFARDGGLDDAAQIVGRSDLDMAWRASAELYRADDRAVMDSRQAKTDIDEPMVFADGRTIWLRTNKVPLVGPDGNVFGLLGTYEDVTVRRQAALDLAESEERFRVTFEQAAVGLAHVAVDGRWLRVNRRLCEMIGYAQDELVGARFQDITHPDDLAVDEDAIRRMLGGEVSSCRFEKRYVRKDGTAAWIALTVSLLRDARGRPKYFISVIEGIEPRRRAERERRELAEIVEQSTDAVVVTDVQGDITYVNPAFERVSGWSRREVEGQNPRILGSGAQTPEWYAHLWSTIRQGRVWTGHFINSRRDGTRFEEDATIFPVRDLAGQIQRFVAIKRDVTQEVRLRDQLQHAQKMEAIGRLAGGVAHDFNNLLTVICGYATMSLDSDDVPEPVRRSLEQISRAGDRAAGLTRQLLAFSRKQVLRPAVVEINAALEESVPILRRLIGEHVDLRFVPGDDAGRVRVDRTQLDQIVFNLAVNARDAMPDGGVLTISTRRDIVTAAAESDGVGPGEFTLLSVADTGVGMDAETLNKIFEPFFTTKEAGHGTGLGLATLYGIVRQSEGHVSVRSEVGAGTTFSVRLPRVDSPCDAVREGPDESCLGSETILLVEDEYAVRALTAELLALAGFHVVEAASGPEALERVGAGDLQIDLVVTDTVMPHMSGSEFVERLRPLQPDAAVLFTSGYTDDAIARHGVLEPGTEFLEKPYSRTVLLARVRSILDRRAPLAAGPRRSA